MSSSSSSFANPGDAPDADLVGAKWSALHDAAGVVGYLAGLGEQPQSPEVTKFPAALRHAAPWRQRIAQQGVDDLAAIMQPGIAALLAVNARGADARAPALALWREFAAARAALLDLAAPVWETQPAA
jgi:hypothetical protein